MDKSKTWVAIITFLAFLVIVGYSVYKWIRFGMIDGSGILFSFLLFSYLINWINWGDHEGGGEKDEMDRHIELKSAKISYYVLMVLAALVLFLSEGVTNLKNIENYPLLIVVGLTFVTLPVTEFFYAKKFK